MFLGRRGTQVGSVCGKAVLSGGINVKTEPVVDDFLAGKFGEAFKRTGESPLVHDDLHAVTMARSLRIGQA